MNTWKGNAHRSYDRLKWGDEVEYVILTFDDADRRVRLSLRGPELLALLQAAENEALHTGNGLEDLKSIWRPEYGSFMIEGTFFLKKNPSLCLSFQPRSF